MPRFVWRIYCPSHHIDMRVIKKTDAKNWIASHIKNMKCQDIWDPELVEAPYLG
jgi:hypothetical protein